MSMPRSKAKSTHTKAGGRIRSGGGATGNKVKNVREATRERPRVRAANPSMVSDWGAHRGAHVTSDGGRDLKFKNEKLYDAGPSFQPVPLGNSLATNVGKGGPGKGREVFARGSQCMTGTPVQGVPDRAPDVPATERSARSLSEKGRVG